MVWYFAFSFPSQAKYRLLYVIVIYEGYWSCMQPKAGIPADTTQG